jgi:hypothetical protein
MHTLGLHGSGGERNSMGPHRFRTLAANQQPKQTALQPTTVKLQGRQATPLGGALGRRWSLWTAAGRGKPPRRPRLPSVPAGTGLRRR